MTSALLLLLLPLLHRAQSTLAADTPRIADSRSAEPFRYRGYYLILTRMPTLGLDAWKQTIDCMKEDGANRLILWVGGGFRSKRFPITWKFNREHQNIRKDFVRPLVEYAHAKGIQTLLGFTPFGYDGVNQYPIEYPELAAKGADGRPVKEFGIYCWGHNLCPSRPEAQQFMREYVHEMYEEFYPNADGLFIESSDYAVCHCKQCEGRYFEKEFQFVRAISDEVWAKKPSAQIVIYPHYFSGAKVAFADAVGAKAAFDRRWTLFFTPHSAKVEPDLMKQAAGSIWWTDGPAWCDVEKTRQAARYAVQAGCDGFIPSLECYTYVPTHIEDGEPWLVGKRQVPFGFGWLKEGGCPYRELPMRVSRFAYRAFTHDPNLKIETFNEMLGKYLFGADATSQAVEDALALTAVFNLDRSWSLPPALTSPGLLRARRDQGRVTDERLAMYRDRLGLISRIASRYGNLRQTAMQEMFRISRWILNQWSGDNAALLAPTK